MEKSCVNCGKVFKKPINESIKNWNTRRKYCSRICTNEYLNLFLDQKIYRYCTFCGKKVKLGNARIGAFKYCSMECKNKDLIGKPTWNKDKSDIYPEYVRKKMGLANKGIRRSPKTEFKKGDNLDIRHPNWKGLNASYVSIHKWVANRKGRPKKCEHCGSINKNRYEWANTDGKYSRNLNDYIRLCKSCHTKYDNKRIKMGLDKV